MFFHLEVRIPFFLDDVAKVMSFLNCTQFLHHFVTAMIQKADMRRWAYPIEPVCSDRMSG